jgi:hypothetical protein
LIGDSLQEIADDQDDTEQPDRWATGPANHYGDLHSGSRPEVVVRREGRGGKED